MNNTDKLLRAFIEVLGYEVKRVRVGDEKCDCYKSNPSAMDFMRGCHNCQGTGISRGGVFDYKVTKKTDKLTVEDIISIMDDNDIDLSDIDLARNWRK